MRSAKGKEAAVSELLTSTSPSQATTEQSLLVPSALRVSALPLYIQTVSLGAPLALIERPMSPSAGQCHIARFR